MPVEVRGLWKVFRGGVEALRGVDLEAREGEVLVLLGPNGSGKSTLLNTIAGLLRPTRGVVRVFGSDPRRLTPRERRQIGMLHESLGIPGPLRVGDYLEAMASYRGCGSVEWAVETLGLGGVLERRIASLSAGYKKRVALAGAVACRPRLVLLDEPYSNVDPTTRLLVDRLVSSLAGRSTVILATHIPPGLAVEAGFRAAIMEEGRVAAVAPGRCLTVYLLECPGRQRMVAVADPAEATRLVREGCSLAGARAAGPGEAARCAGG